MPELVIGTRAVGEDHAPLVIAEVGINHEGSFAKARALIDAAAASGAECIKFQCHITPMEMIPTDMTPGNISTERLWDIIERCELNEDEERRLQSYARERGLWYLSTPFSREAADRLKEMNVPAFKIGSGECNNLPLIEHIARWQRPVILSTGMNDVESVQRSVAVLRRHACPFMLLHCTSLYPAPYESMRLGAIAQLRSAFEVPVGISDHSRGIAVALGAIALGACVVEKHFTVSRSWPGPDNPFSIEPAELAELVAGARAVWQARGGAKTVLADERPVIDFAYASVVSIRPIRQGELLTRENVWVKRPGTGGIPAAALEQVFGKRAARAIPPDTQLTWESIDE